MSLLEFVDRNATGLWILAAMALFTVERAVDAWERR